MAKRAIVNDSLNASKAKRGVDFRIIFGALIVSTVALALGFIKFAVCALPAIFVVGAYLTKDDPNRIDLWRLSLKQHAKYQPRPGALIDDK